MKSFFVSILYDKIVYFNTSGKSNSIEEDKAENTDNLALTSNIEKEEDFKLNDQIKYDLNRNDSNK